MILIYIALGGAAGAVARYGLSGWVQERAGMEFPWGTLVVNVLGSLLIGVALRYMDALDIGREPRAFLVVGLLGGFTTFSTFSYEIVALLQTGEWTRATLYAGSNLLLGVACVLVGLWLGGVLGQPR